MPLALSECMNHLDFIKTQWDWGVKLRVHISNNQLRRSQGCWFSDHTLSNEELKSPSSGPSEATQMLSKSLEVSEHRI